jgi:hypothetical protein
MVAPEAQQDRAMTWSVLDRNDERWRRLRNLICEHSLRVGDFKLSSGRRSPYFFQLRQTTLKGRHCLGKLFLSICINILLSASAAWSLALSR